MEFTHPGFTVSLGQPSAVPVKAEPGRDPLEESLDYETLVMYACGALGETDCAFRLGGFGQADWQLDVKYDLSSFVERLPDLLAGLRAGDDVEVDLYQQAVQRTLDFRPSADGQVEIRCRSWTDWVPDPAVERIALDDLLDMLTGLAGDFATALDFVGSPVARLEPFSDWLVGGM